MSTLRLATAALAIGLAIFLLATYRAEVSMLTIIQDPEFWVAVGFVIVLALFVVLHVPAMVGKMLDKRAAAIAKELDEAKHLREEAAALLASYVQKSAQAESEAAAILAEAKTEAEAYAKEMRTQLRAQIDRRAQMAKDKIEQAETAALSEIRALAADTATAAAAKLIAERMDEKRSAGLVEASLKELPEKLN